MKVQQPLLITSIGNSKAGKTTFLTFIGELLFDNGLKPLVFDFDSQPCSDLYRMVDAQFKQIAVQQSVILSMVPFSIILVDGLRTKEQLDLLRNFNLIVVRVNRTDWSSGHPKKILNKETKLEDTWQIGERADFFISNDDPIDFRLFKFQTRDLFNAEITKCKTWNKCVWTTMKA